MRTSAVVMALGAALASIAGCGSTVSIAAGPMPNGGSYTGVWHSPQYGEMHLTQTGNRVVGDYLKDERSGHLEGSLSGNTLNFEWTEEREMVGGVPQTTRGRGFFRYRIDGAGDHVIQGRWGVDTDNNGGGEWNAVRDRRRRPHAPGTGEEEEGHVEEFDTPGGGGGTSGGDTGD